MRNGNNNFKRIQAAGLAGILMAGLSVVGLPAEPVSAANGWDVDLNAGGTAEASSVSITMGGGTANGQLNAGSTDPNKSAGLVKRTASVEIGATDGYTVTLSGNPNLTGVNSNNKIPTVTSNTTLAQMNNQWGWYTAEGDVDCSALQTMKQMKSTGDQIAAGTLNAKTTKQFTMCFGAKVNGNQAADTYSNTVTLSVVAQPKVVQTFGGIKTMQEMTVEVCNAAKENDTARLTDTRDGTKYWVTKLKDGNCWMSQNLDLNIGGTVIAAYNSNPQQTFTWTVGNNGGTTNASQGTNTNNETYKYTWDFGDYVVIDPKATTSCGYNHVGPSACTGQFAAVGDRLPSSDPNFYKNNGNKTYTDKEYDAHYLVGNYYQWNAATAGTGGTITDTNASASICPKGWKLPNAGLQAEQLATGSFNYMLLRYGLAKANGSSYSGVTGNSTDGNVYNISLSPLFFIRSGYNNPNAGALYRDAGSDGSYWSSRAYTSGSADAYQLYVGPNIIVPSSGGSSGRRMGYPLRCLVQSS